MENDQKVVCVCIFAASRDFYGLKEEEEEEEEEKLRTEEDAPLRVCWKEEEKEEEEVEGGEEGPLLSPFVLFFTFVFGLLLPLGRNSPAGKVECHRL